MFQLLELWKFYIMFLSRSSQSIPNMLHFAAFCSLDGLHHQCIIMHHQAIPGAGILISHPKISTLYCPSIIML